MKRILLSMTALLVAVASFAGPGKATLTTETQIILDGSQPVASSYEADFSHIAYITDEASARKFFGYIKDNLTDFSIDYGSKTVTIVLRTDLLPEGTSWDVNDWNKHYDKTSAYRRDLLNK